MELIEEQIRSNAMVNIVEGLQRQRYLLTTKDPLAAEGIDIASQVVSTAVHVLTSCFADISDDCPTCPYLDSLEEEEEEEFCECGEGEDEEQDSELVDWVVSMLDGAYVPSLGTRIVFCSN